MTDGNALMSPVAQLGTPLAYSCLLKTPPPPPHSLCRLVGDVLLASGFLSYLGPFNQEFRLLLLDLWKKELKRRAIPYTTNVNLIEMLVEPTTVSPLACIYLLPILYIQKCVQYIQKCAVHTEVCSTYRSVCSTYRSVQYIQE